MAIYHFLIDRRTLWGLIAAGTLVGALLFIAGLLVGLHQNLPPEPVQARTDAVQTAAAPATATPTTVQPAPPSTSAPPVSGPVATGPSAPAVRVQASATSAPSASVSGAPRATRPTMMRPTVRRPTVTRPSVTGTPRTASTTLSAPPAGSGATTAQPADGEAVASASPGSGPAAPVAGTAVAATPEPEEKAAPPPLPPPLPTAFSIQVGAYRETRYLEAALEDLRSRGYSPYVVPITGSGGLVFRTIRIGQYRTREEAIRAAAEFHHKESMTALVRTVTPEMRLSHSSTDPSSTAPPATEPPPSVGL